jgi:hypothetical protein
MAKHTLKVIATVAFFLLGSANALADELTERTAIVDRIAGLFVGEGFSELEALHARYRTSRSRTPSGLWHLTVFHGGLSSVFDVERKDLQFWIVAERTAQKWVAAFPNSSAARLTYANMLMNRAWSIRGTGYAHTVRPQDWKPFFEHLQQARTYLEKHKAVASIDPRWYEMMAEIGAAQNWPDGEFSRLVSEGLQREPYFYQLYFAAIDFHVPKWGGSAEAVENFARDALQRTKAAEGFGVYARIYWYASQTQYGSELFSDSLVDWPTMKKGIDDVLKAYPDSWNVNNFARFSCLAKDREKTAELMRRIEWPSRGVWDSSLMYELCQQWAFGGGK